MFEKLKQKMEKAIFRGIYDLSRQEIGARSSEQLLIDLEKEDLTIRAANWIIVTLLKRLYNERKDGQED